MKECHELVSKIIASDACFRNLSLNKKIENYDLFKYPELYNFAHNDKQLLNITSLLSSLKQQAKIKDNDIINYIVSLLKYKTHYGFLCELLIPNASKNQQLFLMARCCF